MQGVLYVGHIINFTHFCGLKKKIILINECMKFKWMNMFYLEKLLKQKSCCSLYSNCWGEILLEATERKRKWLAVCPTKRIQEHLVFRTVRFLLFCVSHLSRFQIVQSPLQKEALCSSTLIKLHSTSVPPAGSQFYCILLFCIISFFLPDFSWLAFLHICLLIELQINILHLNWVFLVLGTGSTMDCHVSLLCRCHCETDFDRNPQGAALVYEGFCPGSPFH